MVIAIGTCSKHPRKLCGLRVRIRGTDRNEWPRAGEEGVIHAVNGHFVMPHDGIEELQCVHVDAMSSFTILFDDGWQTSGYPRHAIELLDQQPPRAIEVEIPI